MRASTTTRRSRASRVYRWLSRLILALLLIVCTALVAVFSFEQYSLRPLAVHLVEKATGRTFSIDGELDARVGRIVSIRAGGIRLGNADWGSRDDLLSIDEAEVSIDLSKLLDGLVAVEDVVVNRAKLIFEEDEQGRSNWAMGSGEEPSAPGNEDQGTMALPIIHSQLSDIDITVQNAALAHPLEVRLDSVEHSVEQGNEFRTTVVGALDNRPLNLQASMGPLTQILNGGAADFDIKADFEAVALEANGHLDKLLAPRQATAQVSLVSAEISQILTTFGFSGVISGATEIKAAIRPSSDHHIVDLAASSDNIKLDVQARFPALDTIDGSSVTLSAQGPDLAAVARLTGLDGLPSQPFKLESSLALAGTQLTIGETNFDTGDTHLSAKGSLSQFPRLEGTNLQLKLVGKNYLEYAALLGLEETAGLQAETFELSTNLEYSTQDQQQFTGRLKLADVGGEFSGKLTGNPAFIGSQLEYLLGGQSDGLLQRLLGRPTAIEGAYVLRGNLERTDTGYGVENAALSIGANELEIEGTIGEDPLRGDTELSMRFHGPDLGKIAATVGYTGFVPAGDAEISALARAQDNAIHVDDLTTLLGRNRLEVSGLISLKPGMAGSRLKVALSGKDIADVLPPEALSYVDARQSYELTGTLVTETGQLSINALQARLGEVTLETRGKVSTTKPLTDLSLEVDARGPDLAAIIPENLLPYSLPKAKFSVSGGVALTEEGLKLDGIDALVGADKLGVSGTIPLDTPGDGLNLVVAASGPDLGALVPLKIDQFDLAGLDYELAGNIQLARGVLSLRELDFAIPPGRLAGRLSVSLDNPVEFGEFDLEASGNNLAEFLPATPAYTPAAVPFDLDALGNWNSKKVRVKEGILKLDTTSIEVQGEVELPPNTAATRLLLSARGDSLANIGQFRDVILPPEEFRIDASLQGNASGLQIPELDVRIGESDLRGSLQFELAEKPRIKTRLESSLLDLAKLLPAEDVAAEGEASSQPDTSDGRIIPRTPVPAHLLNSIDLETEIRLAELRLSHYTLRDIGYDSRLQDGKLEVYQLKASAKQGHLNAQFQASAEVDRIVTNGRLEGKDFSLGITEASGGETELPKQDLILEFDTEGATIRELAANMDGFVQLTGDEGRLRNSRALGMFGSFYSELFSAINPVATREPYTNISCFAAYGEIEDGVAKINPGAVLQTDKLEIFAIGQVDLKTEQVSLRFDSTARKGIGISVADFVNPFVGVSGTLASPKLGVDPENAMFEGGFAYATGGLSIIAKSLYSRWFGSKDSCALFEQEAEEFLQERQAAKEKRMAEQEEATPEDQ
jgi:uncharacterized protein involved in outer membrane biogenesis